MSLHHQVTALTLTHPEQGAVYWESPVKVELEVTLEGEFEEGLNGIEL